MDYEHITQVFECVYCGDESNDQDAGGYCYASPDGHHAYEYVGYIDEEDSFVPDYDNGCNEIDEDL